MRVFYDHQAFTFQKRGGISRLFVELLREFSGDSTINAELPLAFSSNIHLRAARLSNHRDLLPAIESRWKTLATRAANQWRSVRRLRRHNYDVFHPTYYDPYFIKHIGDKPFVLTIYDMTPELFGGGVSFLESLVIRKDFLARRAARIIAISDTTKQDAMRFFNISEDRIDVIPLATSLVLQPDHVHITPALPENYMLYVGNRRLYKNFDLFVTALAPLLRRARELAVVCVGGGPFLPAELGLLAKLGIERQVIQYEGVDDHALASLYAAALVFVFPSLYEGFGIPVLEAFACRCPVAAARAGSLPEVAGDAAIYFDPSNAEDLRSTVARILADSELRDELRRLGDTRLKKFSWSATAAMTRASYERACRTA